MANNLAKIVYKIAMLMLIYSGVRVLFYGMNRLVFASHSSFEIATGFLMGLRFDLSHLIMINAPFILLALIPLKNFSDTWKSILKKLRIFFFCLVNIPFVWVNLVDAEYFKFTGRRTSLGVSGIAFDIGQQARQLTLQYWHFILLGIALSILVYFIAKSERPFHQLKSAPLTKARYISIVICTLCITILGARGGIQRKPLDPAHAFILGSNALGNLALNTPFNMLHLPVNAELPLLGYFSSWEELRTNIDRPWPASNLTTPQTDNVIILIMESFASEYIGTGNPYPGYTPFFDELAKQGTLFSNHFANGRRSIEGIVSVLAGLPSLMDDPFLVSVYKGFDVVGLPNYLKPHGYKSLFFHGGHNGTMFFDVFARQAGFEEYYGFNEYPYHGNYDGNWGIFDEPFLRFMIEKLDQTKQPFLSSFFSLSSHNPYAIPSELRGKFNKGTLAIHESIGYADYALRKFFEIASQKPWYKNTLFIITADHTTISEVPRYQTDTGAYRVPLLFFHPGGKIPPSINPKLAQHADILPTVLHFLNIKPNKVMEFGHPLFDEQGEGRVINHASGTWWLTEGDYVLKHIPPQTTTVASLKSLDEVKSEELPPETVQKLTDKMLPQLRGYMQYFQNGLNQNRIYDWTSTQDGGAPR